MAIAKIYIISDTHFGHKNILRYRTHERFPEFVGAEMTPQEHDQKLEERILETVNRKDTLWMLGDSFFSMDSLDVLRRIRTRVARLNLVLGNHCFQNCSAGEGLATVFRENLADRIEGMVKLKISGGGKFAAAWLTHTPMHPTEIFKGNVNIHGHTHAKVIDDPLYFNANCENLDFRPVELSRISQGYRGELIKRGWVRHAACE